MHSIVIFVVLKIFDQILCLLNKSNLLNLYLYFIYTLYCLVRYDEEVKIINILDN